MKQVAPLRYDVIFKKAFGDKAIGALTEEQIVNATGLSFDQVRML